MNILATLQQQALSLVGGGSSAPGGISAGSISDAQGALNGALGSVSDQANVLQQLDQELQTLSTKISALQAVNDPAVLKVTQALQAKLQGLQSVQTDLEQKLSAVQSDGGSALSTLQTDPTIAGILNGSIDPSSWGPSTISGLSAPLSDASSVAGLAATLLAGIQQQEKDVQTLSDQVSQEETAAAGQGGHPTLNEIAQGAAGTLGSGLKWLAAGFGVAGLAVVLSKWGR